jgi:hypothetical protein
VKQNTALKVLGEVMKWDDERVREEYKWLELMSRLKYDTYRGFFSGLRFIESLVYWLQQFTLEERETAYALLREKLVYIGPAEMQHLVELTYPATVRPRLVRELAHQIGMPLYRMWTRQDMWARYSDLLRRTLFFALSDGARIDAFRRSTAGVISNEQVVVGPQIHKKKWDSLLKKLRRDTEDPDAAFAVVYLIDDFVGSGKTLLREEESDGSDGRTFDGKLIRFWQQVEERKQGYFQGGWTLCVHHYIATHRASTSVMEQEQAVRKAKQEQGQCWFPKVTFSFGTVLPEDLPVGRETFPRFARLVDKYYDKAIRTKSMDIGGTDGRWGFNGCALPLVLEHNTPNNSVALLWAETEGKDDQHAMRPLFYRRQRHA